MTCNMIIVMCLPSLQPLAQVIEAKSPEKSCSAAVLQSLASTAMKQLHFEEEQLGKVKPLCLHGYKYTIVIVHRTEMMIWLNKLTSPQQSECLYYLSFMSYLLYFCIGNNLQLQKYVNFKCYTWLCMIHLFLQVDSSVNESQPLSTRYLSCIIVGIMKVHSCLFK